MKKFEAKIENRYKELVNCQESSNKDEVEYQKPTNKNKDKCQKLSNKRAEFDVFSILPFILVSPFLVGLLFLFAYMLFHSECHICHPYVQHQTEQGYKIPIKSNKCVEIKDKSERVNYEESTVQQQCDDFNKKHGFFKDEQGYMFDINKVTCESCLERIKNGYDTPHLPHLKSNNR